MEYLNPSTVTIRIKLEEPVHTNPHTHAARWALFDALRKGTVTEFTISGGSCEAEGLLRIDAAGYTECVYAEEIRVELKGAT